MSDMLIFLLLLCVKSSCSLMHMSGVFRGVGGQNESYPDYSQFEGSFLKGTFPPGFKWGAATSAYQVEGGWNADGKGPSTWDAFVRQEPSPVVDGSTGDVACDSYHKYPVDVKLLHKMGVDFYRFSMSWSRLLTDGRIGSKNQAGIDYYNNLIDLLLKHNIQPLVTLYHFDLPLALQNVGGWLNEDLVQYFAEYAFFAFETFGDRVKTWTTFQEPVIHCTFSYEQGTFPPGVKDPQKPYTCAHTMLKAHAFAYRIYDSVFKPVQAGRCGITLHCLWLEPGTQHKRDIAAAERGLQFGFGWFASPIFFGDYPEVMREFVDRKSKEEGLTHSRLPTFDVQWQKTLKGSYDFLSVDHYTTLLVRYKRSTTPGYTGDQDLYSYQDPSWHASASSWLKVVPWGFRRALNWIKKTYGNPVVLVTENGVSGEKSEEEHDPQRVSYLRDYINNMLKAIVLDGCNVQAYTVSSLLDNFLWFDGYSQRFGLHHVNFTSPERTRKAKDSAKYYTKIITHKGFQFH